MIKRVARNQRRSHTRALSKVAWASSASGRVPVHAWRLWLAAVIPCSFRISCSIACAYWRQPWRLSLGALAKRLGPLFNNATSM